MYRWSIDGTWIKKGRRIHAIFLLIVPCRQNHSMKFIKNVSSPKYNKKKLCDCGLGLILPSTFIYEPILMKLSMNANIVKEQIFHKIMYGLKSHWRSHKVTFMHFLIDIFFLWNLIFYKLCMNNKIIKTKNHYNMKVSLKNKEGHKIAIKGSRNI